MNNFKLAAGEPFPAIIVSDTKGGEINLSKPTMPHDWRVVVVYRGKHCPICTRYLTELNAIVPKLSELGIDLVAVSADTLEKANAHLLDVEPVYPVGYGLSVEQMQQLGLYISEPRSPEESDRAFAEPGLFVINDQGQLQLVDIANAPFARPSLESLVMGLRFIRNPDNNYPIRGTHKANSTVNVSQAV